MRNRDEIILQLLNHQGKVSVQELAQQCEMSVETIRRDLNRLEKKGLLYRIHGGAVSGKTNDIGSFFQIRQHINAAAKRHIAQNALELLYENAVIGLDASSTSWYFAYLMPDIPCTVVTNSIFNINALVNKPNMTARLKLKGIDGGPHKRWSMWFNSKQREEPYQVLTSFDHLRD